MLSKLSSGTHVFADDLERSLAKLRKTNERPWEGVFGPASLSWRINRESALFLAGGRAALLQLAHPWVAAAIAQHSRTLRDPIGRFHQTFRVMFTMVFGSLEDALNASRHLHRRHEAIRGRVPQSSGSFAEGSHYEANHLDALRWVYATLVESAVLAYELVLPPLDAAEGEQYYSESKKTAALFGIPADALPRNWSEFGGYMRSMYNSQKLAVSSGARGMAHELQADAGTWLRPPFWYRALTVHLLPQRFRTEFELSYGEQEQRAAARAIWLLPRVYRRLPACVRFVGPYHEAQARLRGASRPGALVQLSNRLWVGRRRCFDDGAKLRRT